MSHTTDQYTGNLQALLTWAKNVPQSMRAENRKDFPPAPYRAWIEDRFPVDRQYLKYWTKTITPATPLDTSGEWVEKFPHIHTESVGWDPSIITMMLYLVVPDSGGEIAVGGYNENDPYTLIPLTPGLVVSVDALLWHGVKPVLAGERTALIVSGFPMHGFSEVQATDNMLRKTAP